MPHEFDTEVILKKEEIRKSLFRANSLAVFLVAVLVLLGLGAVLQAFRAERAEAEAKEKLWDSYLTQARALRFSGQVGRKQQILNVVKAAAQIKPSAELRDEAIAALAMIDLKVEGDLLPVQTPGFDVQFDGNLDRYLLTHGGGSFVVRAGNSRSNLFQGTSARGIDHSLMSAQGGYIVIVDYDLKCHVWDLREKAEILSIATEKIARVDISADERHLWVLTKPQQLSLFDLDDGSEVDRFPLAKGVSGIKVAPNGKLVALVEPQAVSIYRYEEEKFKFSRRILISGDSTSLSWTSDSRHLAVGSTDWNIYVTDVQSGAGITLKGHKREVVTIAFSPVDSVLMSYSWDGTTRFWNPFTGDALFLTHEAWGKRWSADGKRIGIYKHNTGVGRWGFEYSDCLLTMTAPLGTAPDVRVVDFSRDSKYFLAGNADRMMMYETESAGIVAEVAERDLKGASFLPDNETLVTSAPGRVRLWKLQAEGAPGLTFIREISVMGRRMNNATVSSSGNWTAITGGDREIPIFSGKDFEKEHAKINHFQGASVEFSPDEKRLVVGSWFGRGVAVYDLPGGKLLKELSDRDAAVSWSSEGGWIVAGGADAYRIYDGGNYSNVWTIQRNSAAQTSPNSAWKKEGKQLAITLTGLSQEIVDVSRKEVVTRLIPPFQKVVSKMVFSPDGKYLGVTTYESAIYLWNLEKLEKHLNLIGLNLFESMGSITTRNRGDRFLVYTILFVVSMAGALVIGLTALKKHRRLLYEYASVEAGMLRRSKELEVARAELTHSQKMRALGTLAAGIAHDFNNLLSIIRMANQLTARDSHNSPEVKENTQVIEHAVRQGKDVVKSMLGYSRENGSAPLVVAIPEVVEDIVPLLSRQFLSGVTLDLELDYTVPMVRTVPQRLEQIILNLIVNASEALQGQGRLTIGVSGVKFLPQDLLLRPASGPEYVRIAVSDNGTGIPAEIVDRIFEPFFTTKTSGTIRGTGLGLSIVHTIAEEEGYGIRLVNNPGKGVSFQIFVPTAGVQNTETTQSEVVSSG